MIISEAPSRWVILKIDNQSTYKVFGTWAGGYLDGQSWKLNSGIAKVTEDENNYYFYGHSGSCYKCGKDCYGTIGYGRMVLDELLNNKHVTLMEDNKDWCNFLNK